jgi:hypothetical protein
MAGRAARRVGQTKSRHVTTFVVSRAKKVARSEDQQCRKDQQLPKPRPEPPQETAEANIDSFLDPTPREKIFFSNSCKVSSLSA